MSGRTDFTHLDRFLDSLLDFGFPMYDCTVWAHHEELYRRQGGFIDVMSRRTHEPDTKYFLYSCTKPVTTAAALTLLERGKIKLSDPLSAYLPEYGDIPLKERDGTLRPPKEPITLCHLFTMTAGIPFMTTTRAIKDVIAETDGRAPTREIVRAIAKEPLVADPGEKWVYSLCHDILAAVVEAVTGRRFADFVRETVFLPLGMKNSSFHLDGADADQMATQYTFAGDATVPYEIPLRNPYIFGDEYDSGGAGMISTLEDYILFADAMASGGVGKTGARILSPETIELWRRPALKPSQMTDFWGYLGGYNYGLGVRTLTDRSAGNKAPLGEFGWGGAAGAFAYMSPETGVSVYLAQHTRNSVEGRVMTPLLNAVFTSLGL